jgi:(2Fe-2S) ferredoxin
MTPTSSSPPTWYTTSIDAKNVSYYQRHIFFCTNDRGPGADRPSCNRCGSAAIRDYVKTRIKELALSGEGKIRVNKAGCLDRCEEGPVCVVYPEGTWYTYVDETDVDDIIESHLVGGVPVERLKI